MGTRETWHDGARSSHRVKQKGRFSRLLAAFAALSLAVAACGSDGATDADEPADTDAEAAPADETEEEPSAEAGDDGSGEPYYEGSTIEWIIPYGEGGGTTANAVFMTEFLERHIPGNPSIQIVNIPGSDSIIGTNEFHSRRDSPNADHVMLFSSSGTHHHWVFGTEGVVYDLAQYEPLLGTPAGAVVYVSPSTGVESIEDLMDPDEPLVYGNQNFISAELARLIAFDALDFPVQIVSGYGSRGEARVAFEQGETNIDAQTTAAFLSNVEPLVEAGEAIPLFTQGMLNSDGELVRDPAFPDLPHIGEVYETLHGDSPSGQQWDSALMMIDLSNVIQKIAWVHDTIPQEAIDALLEGFQGMYDDPEFQERVADELGEYDVLIGAQNEAAIARMRNIDQDNVDWVVDWLNETYGVEARSMEN